MNVGKREDGDKFCTKFAFVLKGDTMRGDFCLSFPKEEEEEVMLFAPT